MTTKTKAEKAMSKSEITAALAETTGLTKAQISTVFDSLFTLIGKNVGNDGPGIFTLPGLLKIKVVRKPAVPARTGISRLRLVGNQCKLTLGNLYCFAELTSFRQGGRQRFQKRVEFIFIHLARSRGPGDRFRTVPQLWVRTGR